MIPQYEPEFGIEEQEALAAYMKSGGWLTEGKETLRFEGLLGVALETPYVSVVSNGTVSLSLALLALGIGPGDRVIVPDLTMIATANAVSLIGAQPILCDVDPSNLCLDLAKALEFVRLFEAKAVLYVSLNGRSHTATELLVFKSQLAELGAVLIEDAAQSLGSQTTDGRKIGTIGDIGSFSFSPHKICSTGQGGCLVTKNQAIYEKVERLKDFGRLQGGADIHDHFGINAKFTDLQAVVGIEQVKKLNQRIRRKKEIYRAYEERLSGVVEFLPLWGSTPWFVDIYTYQREELRVVLEKLDVRTRPLYPALHTQKIFREAQSFPVASSWAERGLWLPSSFSIQEKEIDQICDRIRGFFS